MYNLNIKKVISTIQENKLKKILLQLPDGLKPKIKEIQSEILKETNCEIFIWSGSCFGACDVPREAANKINADMIIQWGHSKWN